MAPKICWGSHSELLEGFAPRKPLQTLRFLIIPLLFWPIFGRGKLFILLPPWSLTVRPWKMVVGRLLSYWEGNFSGAQKRLPTKKIVYSVDINQHDGMTVVMFIRCGAAGVAEWSCRSQSGSWSQGYENSDLQTWHMDFTTKPVAGFFSRCFFHMWWV